MWSDGEITAVQRHFDMKESKLPGKSAIVAALGEEPVLKNRTWSDVKNFIRNRKVTLSRKIPKHQEFQF